MKAKLIGYTQPVENFSTESGVETIQDLIAYCARVSNPANQNNTQTSEKLINYLINNKHFSPFEMVNVTLELETTRDIARQILRHRSFTFQEFSQRYADPQDMEDSFITREARLQDTKNRQNSVELEDSEETRELKRLWEHHQQSMIEHAQVAYNWAIEKGIAKEVARAVLPEGLTKSRMYMNGSIRSWIHYLDLRTGNGTQKEHMLIAREIAKAISEIFPIQKFLKG